MSKYMCVGDFWGRLEGGGGREEGILSCCGRYAGILHGACGLSRRDRQ